MKIDHNSTKSIQLEDIGELMSTQSRSHKGSDKAKISFPFLVKVTE